jgi:bacillithiol biosynthesis cysteine-adding enzyme BshC
MNISIQKTENVIFYYSRLYQDYIFDFSRLKNFFTYDYRVVSQYKQRVEFLKKTYNSDFKKSLCKDLYDYNRTLKCGRRTLENIDVLQKKDTFVLISGQQPGIFTGPLYTIYKIITTISLSEMLSKKFNIKIVPLFWNASDDNDIDEIKSVNIPSGNLENISIDVPEYLGRLSFSKIRLPLDEYENLFRKMLDSLQATEFKKDIDIFLNDIFITLREKGKDNGLPISSFFSVLTAKLFEEHGLIIIDPKLPALKKLSRKIIEFDISKHTDIHGAIDFTSAELSALGYHKQLKMLKDSFDFFLNTGNGRSKIKIKNQKTFYIQGSESGTKELSLNELKDALFKNLSDTALNVITRPLLQDWVLPNIATVCGPGEISYYAQIKDVYTLFGIEMPVIVPRLSGTIVEKKIKDSMQKIKLNYKDMEFLSEKQTRTVLKSFIGFDISSFLTGFETRLHKLIDTKKEILKNHEIEVAGSFNRIENNLKKEIEILGKRIISEYSRKNSYIADSINKIYNNLFPNNNLQERYVNIFDYINRYGFEIIKELIANTDPLDFMHKIIEIV